MDSRHPVPWERIVGGVLIAGPLWIALLAFAEALVPWAEHFNALVEHSSPSISGWFTVLGAWGFSILVPFFWILALVLFPAVFWLVVWWVREIPDMRIRGLIALFGLVGPPFVAGVSLIALRYLGLDVSWASVSFWGQFVSQLFIMYAIGGIIAFSFLRRSHRPS